MTEKAADASAYRVLARKYRPSTFDDLIGQEAMVQTLTNAFELNRIAQAYMLTGVRGVGKTTTARILARALNYEAEGVTAPTITMPDLGEHCEAIINSSHIDVIEMDAASHTGINDIREIIEAVKYKPAAARYKVYIIDEVHMLSNAAFNGLLKTLEEPPEHVKFIFATTEIRKVPVTILSRCQRFDLRRIEGEVMVDFLRGVCGKEDVQVSDEALALVARASEGSVRDALSLLDQAISHGGGAVEAEQMRDMLGLADRSRVIDLFAHLMSGRVKEALEEIKAQHDVGAAPLVILSDLADFTHLVTTAKVAGDVPRGQALSDLEREKALEFAADLSIRVLSRTWQMLLKGIEEVQSSAKPLAAADMVIVRIAYVADLPTPDEAMKMLQQGGGEMAAGAPQTAAPAPNGGGAPVAQMQAVAGGAAMADAKPVGRIDLEPAPQTDIQVSSEARPRPVLASNNPNPTPTNQGDAPKPPSLRIARFEDLIALAEEKRDLSLRAALEAHVRLVAFENGRIEFSPLESAPSNLAPTLKAKLQEWTGAPWTVILAREGGAAPLRQQRAEEERQRAREAEEDPIVAAALKQFPGAKIVNITYLTNQTEDILEAAPDDEENGETP